MPTPDDVLVGVSEPRGGVVAPSGGACEVLFGSRRLDGAERVGRTTLPQGGAPQGVRACVCVRARVCVSACGGVHVCVSAPVRVCVCACECVCE